MCRLTWSARQRPPWGPIRARDAFALMLLVLPNSSVLSAAEAVRWMPDDELNGVRYGAREVWNGKLWGFDRFAQENWVYDDANGFRSAGGMPEDRVPIMSMFTDDGAYVLASHRQPGGLVNAEILHSPDGIQDYEVALSMVSTNNGVPFAAGHEHTLVDLGEGRLMMAEYSDEARLFFSADAGQNWRVLIQPESTSIRHFHGAVYDREKGKLYAMAGDGNRQAGIMVVDDIFGENGLVNNPAIWRTRWGLDDARRTTLDPQYLLKVDGIANSQHTRTVDMEIDGDYIYWGEDFGFEEGQRVYRAHRDTMEVEQVGDGHIVGVPWRFLRTDDGRLIFFTASSRVQGQRRPGMDDFVHLYEFNQERTGYAEVARFPVRENASSGATAYAFVEAFDRFWISGYNVTERNVDLVGRLVSVRLGDYDDDGQLSVTDIDHLSAAIRHSLSIPVYDLDLDGVVDQDDRTAWVSLRGTMFGDANLDGRFDSGDLLQVMTAGLYEVDSELSSGWSEGDWDGNGEFESDDFIWALANGTYAVEARLVPEPKSYLGVIIVLVFACRRHLHGGT